MADRTNSYAAQEAARRDDIATIVATIDKQESKYTGILPSNVSWADFRNAFLISVQMNPRLLDADRQSLWLGLQNAASAGLKPDGREGALVIFGDDSEDEDGNPVPSAAKGKKKVVWMPMIGGLIKLVRNTGEIANIRAKVVYRGERVIITDEDGKETYKHVREIDERSEIDDSPANIIGAFAVVNYKNGFWEMEPMSRRQIDRVKATSRAKKGSAPWNVWYDEMAKKTVLRRLIKRLDKSAELRKVAEVLEGDPTMTIDGDPAVEVANAGVAAIEQDNSIKQEFTKPAEKVAAKQEQKAKEEPKQEVQQKPKEEAKPQQADSTDRSQNPGAGRQTAPAADHQAPSGPASGSGQPAPEPVEIWAVDDNGEPVERVEPMSPIEFAEWFAAAMMVSQRPDALREHNADAMGDAGADPKAAAIITDAIARRAEYEEKARGAAQARRTPEQENGAAQSKPMSETPADAGKPQRKAIEVPKTPKGAQHWGNYGPLAKAEILVLANEADIADWIATNLPTYKGKACEIAIDNWLRDRRKILGIGQADTVATQPAMTNAELVGSIKAQVSTLESDDAILEWSKSPAVRSGMLEIQRTDKVAFTDLISFIDDRRLAVSPPEPPQ